MQLISRSWFPEAHGTSVPGALEARGIKSRDGNVPRRSLHQATPKRRRKYRAVFVTGRPSPRRDDLPVTRPLILAHLFKSLELLERGAMIVHLRCRFGHSFPLTITSAADCLPRRSPPASSPANMAKIKRLDKGRDEDASKLSALLDNRCSLASMLPAMLN
jgi:hypothetical protein